MSDKIYHDNNFNFHEPEQYQGQKYPLSKLDFELFDEDKNKPSRTIRVKRLGIIDKTERWKIFQDDILLFTVEGAKLSKKERAFLRGVDGTIYLIQEFKSGIKSLKELKTRLKKHLIDLTKTHKKLT